MPVELGGGEDVRELFAQLRESRLVDESVPPVRHLSQRPARWLRRASARAAGPAATHDRAVFQLERAIARPRVVRREGGLGAAALVLRRRLPAPIPRSAMRAVCAGDGARRRELASSVGYSESRSAGGAASSGTKSHHILRC